MNLFKPRCPHCHCQSSHFIKKDGHYFRQNDSRHIQRYRCAKCCKKFSRATSQLEYRQKKRRVNLPLLRLLASGVSQRRCALLLKLNKNTVAKKFDYLAQKYRHLHRAWLQKIPPASIQHVQLDDLITIEHTKLKPLTVSAMVNPQNRQILSIKVGRIPAFGHLAHLSKTKYGPRPNQHRQTLRRLFKEVKPCLHPNVLIQSDEHHNYPPLIKRFAPQARHQGFKGAKSCASGQGELKRLAHDPLFMINHTYAMLRANINRLVRRTWCTTKLPEKLQQHLEIYMWYHNRVLLRR